MGIAVSVTEVMEKLGLEFDPGIHVIFHPLIVSFSTFVTSGLQEALDCCKDEAKLIIIISSYIDNAIE